MKPGAKRPAPTRARIDVSRLPLRDGAPDDDGVLAPLPDCPHCKGTGRVECPTEPSGDIVSIPCGCGEPPGFSEWMEEFFADLGAAPTLRDLARTGIGRLTALLADLDHLETVRRRGPPQPAPEVTHLPTENIWESVPGEDD